ncbi:MAG: hypothetical protein HFG05_12450 [Oscillibacter sp.]|nr:hypothetical protein [Oscillibacter sp.]
MKGGSQTLAEKLQDDGVFTEAEGTAAGVLGDKAGWTYTYTAPEKPSVPTAPSTPAAGAIVHEKKNVGKVTANMLTVDPKLATVKTALVDNTLGHTAPFSKIVEDSGAAAVINGNFFASYSDFKIPVGHVMVWTGNSSMAPPASVLWASPRTARSGWAARRSLLVFKLPIPPGPPMRLMFPISMVPFSTPRPTAPR